MARKPNKKNKTEPVDAKSVARKAVNALGHAPDPILACAGGSLAVLGELTIVAGAGMKKLGGEIMAQAKTKSIADAGRKISRQVEIRNPFAQIRMFANKAKS
jgi:hypothetical protein